MNDEQLKYYLMAILGLIIVSGMAIARLYGVFSVGEAGEIEYGDSEYKVAFIEEQGVRGVLDADDPRLTLDESIRFDDLPTLEETQQALTNAVVENTTSDMAFDSELGTQAIASTEVVANTETEPENAASSASPVTEPAGSTNTTSLLDALKPNNLANNNSNTQIAENVPDTVAEEAKPAPITKPSPRWWVQLGTFGIRENALRVYDKTSTAGYKTVIDEMLRGGKKLYVVRIPTNGDRKNASQLVNNIHEEFGFDAIVVRF